MSSADISEAVTQVCFGLDWRLATLKMQRRAEG